MPYTPYHFGPSGFLGLAFRRWIDLPMFLLGNVIVDVEVLFASVLLLGNMVGNVEVSFTSVYPHRYWHLHSFLVGGLAGAICGAILYFAKPLRKLFEWAMRLLHIHYRASLWKMMLGGITGAWVHVFVDSFYHYDVEPFWPKTGNPFHRFARTGAVRITPDQIEIICIVFFVFAVILYAVAIRLFLKHKHTDAEG